MTQPDQDIIDFLTKDLDLRAAPEWMIERARAFRDGEWQPIETAPKDGEDIIVGYDLASVWIIHVAFWNDGQFWDTEGFPNKEVASGWWSYIDNSVGQRKLDNYHEPTHWRPLPTPPKDQNQ